MHYNNIIDIEKDKEIKIGYRNAQIQYTLHQLVYLYRYVYEWERAFSSLLVYWKWNEYFE